MANLISYSRILLSFLFIYLISRDQIIFAVAVILVAVFTDTFDGLVARKLNQVTKFGAALDPLADKVLVICVCIAILIKFWQPAFIAISALLLSRELIMLIGFIFFRSKKVEIEITYFGKCVITFLFTAFVVTFILPNLGIYLLWISVILYFTSAFSYLIEAWRKIV